MAFVQELRLAGRTLAKNKGWTAVAALALALGLGANIAIFSIVGLMIWTPLPYPHPEQLVYVMQTNPRRDISQASVSLPDARDWAAGSAFAALAAYRSLPLAVSGQGEPQHLPAMQVTPEFFPTLGILPARGRSFTAAETPEAGSRSAIISHELWQGMFRGDPAVLGRGMRLDGRNYDIVGVMPEGFQYLFQRTDVWIPLSLDQKQRERGWRGLGAVARLKPGVPIARAAAEVRSISERVEKEEPGAGRDWRGAVQPLAFRVSGRGARAAAGSMFGGVAFVLLIACANVASLLLARGTQRRRELAIRASLGAGWASLIRLQLAESLLLCLLGGAIGVLAAVWTLPLLKRIAPPFMPVLQTASIDWSALGFALALSLATGILCGVLPAWYFARGELAPMLQDSSRGSTGGRHRALKSLVVGEIALTIVLVAASTLMIRSLIRQASVDVGFDKTNLITGQVFLLAARYPDKAQVIDFYARALENLRRDGNVISAALVQTIPLGGNNTYSRVRIEGDLDAEQDKLTGDMVVSPGYFETMRIPLLVGRDFTGADNAGAARVAIVNETFARRYWPKEPNPVGRRVRMGGEETGWTTVVGLARDVRHRDPMEPPRPEIYRPHSQVAGSIMTLVARGRGSPQSAAAPLRSAVWEVDRDQPVFRLESPDALLFNRNAGERATTQVLGGLAVIALILAAVGTYGVMAYTTAQRVREIGIRLAMGATARDVFRTVLGGGMGLAVLGVLLGLPAAYGVAPVLRAVVSGLDARDAAAYGGVALLLAAVALGACVIPAWRAMRIDPASVLRSE